LENLDHLVQNEWIDWIKENYIRAKTRLFKKNQIIHYGRPCHGIYLVISGKVKTMKMVKMAGNWWQESTKQTIFASTLFFLIMPTRIPQRH
jgi:hypothetical protein